MKVKLARHVRVTYVVLRIGVPSAEFITYYSIEKRIDISCKFAIKTIYFFASSCI